MSDETTIYSVAMVLLTAFGYLFGSWGNPVWRCKRLRQFTRADWKIVIMQDRGIPFARAFVVNADNGHISIGDRSWVISKNRIYRKDDEKQGFFMLPQFVRFEDGAPVVYVDTADTKPIGFENSESKVSSEELAANEKSYLSSEKSKILAKQNMKEILLYVILIASLAGAALGFLAFDKTTQIEQKINQFQPQEVQASASNGSVRAMGVYESFNLSAEMPSLGVKQGVSIYG